MLLTSGSQTSHFSVFLRADPVDSWIVSDGLVGWVNENDLEELKSGILSNPVGVEDSETWEFSSDFLLGNALVVFDIFESDDSNGFELSAHNSLWGRSFSVSSSDLDPVNDVALFGLVSESSGSLNSAGFGTSVDGSHLSVLPGSHSENELHDSGLFLLP